MLAALVALILLAQLVRTQSSKPAVRSDLPAAGAAENALRRACYDCHSNETRWPWYAKIPPTSWLAARHVAEGRKRLNFSRWDAYMSDPATAITKLRRIRRLVAAGKMAPWYYRLLHREARLTAGQRDAIAQWVAEQISSLDAR